MRPGEGCSRADPTMPVLSPLPNVARHEPPFVNDEFAEPLRTADRLIRRHQVGVRRYLRMLGCDDSLADDLTQETFLKVLSYRDFTQHNDQATAAYLRRTAYHLLVSHHRKGGRAKTIYTADPLDEVWNRWAGADINGDPALDHLQTCLSGLGDRARLALTMRYADNASRSEIAAALNITEHGARNLMQRAKEQLRDCVQSKLSETPS